MPPTISEMTAMQAISSFIVPVVLSIVCLMLSVLIIKKSFLPCRAVKIASMLSSATWDLTESLTRTVIELMSLPPVILYIAVV